MKDAVEAIKRGATDFIQKPFQFDELMHVLTNALELQDVSRLADLTLPLPGWMTLTNGVFGSVPVTFDDLAATSSARRFYVISVP